MSLSYYYFLIYYKIIKLFILSETLKFFSVGRYSFSIFKGFNNYQQNAIFYQKVLSLKTLSLFLSVNISNTNIEAY